MAVVAEGKFAGVEFVAVGMGNAVHAPYVYRTIDGVEILGAQCDRTSWAGGVPKKVRPVKAQAVTCGRCKRISEVK